MRRHSILALESSNDKGLWMRAFLHGRVDEVCLRGLQVAVATMQVVLLKV